MVVVTRYICWNFASKEYILWFVNYTLIKLILMEMKDQVI
jgi:hypothetical protein